jgi:hypothetical protein
MSQAEPLTLMALWSRHKRDCRSVGSIVAEARAGKLPGITPAEDGFGFRVVDETTALTAMKGH